MRLKLQVVPHHAWRVESCRWLFTRKEKLEKLDLRQVPQQSEAQPHVQRELVLESLGLPHPVQTPTLCLELASDRAFLLLALKESPREPELQQLHLHPC